VRTWMPSNVLPHSCQQRGDVCRWPTGCEPQAYRDQYDLRLTAVIRICRAILGRMNGSLTKTAAEVVLYHFSKEEFGLVLEVLTRGMYSMYARVFGPCVTADYLPGFCSDR
jgi:hypothetical protein